MMISTIAALAAKPTVLENVSFIVGGFVFVVVVLATLSIVTSLIGVLCSRLIKEPTAEQKPAPQAAPAAKPAAAATKQVNGIEADEDIPAHVIALIAAATHVILEGRPQRIVSIRGTTQGWAQEGRREIFSSHRVR
ncbi:OadG family transporter subunit [Pelagicoccus mobilis]|uniref:OadG family protein n=1 Tax=Pelagicoccus mobilis TaxID=415221 RepID=A0A934S3T1_9BACT|nr:OadG family transporter subunit [Pelagicoccus mobilis]MBK1880574.1 OadG family protein [Pelagicoccus mobilis]